MVLIGASVADPLVVLIRSQPGMAERLLVAHADDGSGRCKACSAGAQTGRYRFPCAIGLAAAATVDVVAAEISTPHTNGRP